MRLSLNIILDALSLYKLDNHVPETPQLSFVQCLPLPRDAKALSPDCLYISRLSALLEYDRADHSFTCICLRDRIPDSLETAAFLKGLVIINENISENLVFTVVQNHFFDISNWMKNLMALVLTPVPLGDIIDAAAPSLGQPLCLLDPSQKVMAHARTVPCDDPLYMDTITDMYCTNATILERSKGDIEKVWDQETALRIDDTCLLSRYSLVSKTITNEKKYIAKLVMWCKPSGVTPGLLELFEFLADMISRILCHGATATHGRDHIYDTFLVDLLEGTIKNESFAEKHAVLNGLRANKQLMLLQIAMKDENGFAKTKLVTGLQALFKHVSWVPYAGFILAVCQFDDDTDVHKVMAEQEKSLEQLLTRLDAYCSISQPFTRFTELHFGYVQTSKALRYMNKFRGRALLSALGIELSPHSRILRYDTFYIHTLFGDYDTNEAFWFHSDYHKKFRLLYDYDVLHGSKYLNILYVFLNNERSASITGKITKMHRNNVLYHTKKLEQLLGVDLNNVMLRSHLRASFILLELYGFNPESSPGRHTAQ